MWWAGIAVEAIEYRRSQGETTVRPISAFLRWRGPMESGAALDRQRPLKLCRQFLISALLDGGASAGSQGRKKGEVSGTAVAVGRARGAVVGERLVTVASVAESRQRTDTARRVHRAQRLQRDRRARQAAALKPPTAAQDRSCGHCGSKCRSEAANSVLFYRLLRHAWPPSNGQNVIERNSHG